MFVHGPSLLKDFFLAPTQNANRIPAEMPLKNRNCPAILLCRLALVLDLICFWTLKKVNFVHFREPRSRRLRHEMTQEWSMLFITVWSQHGVSFGSIENDLDDRRTRQSREKCPSLLFGEIGDFDGGTAASAGPLAVPAPPEHLATSRTRKRTR